MIPSRSPDTAIPRRRFLGRVLTALAGMSLLRRAPGAEAAVQEVIPYLGEIMLFSGNFAPKGWMMCNGQLLPINQNQALFSILGTTYGGDGRVNFALPDLRARVPIHRGLGPGLTNRALGSTGGEAAHTLVPTEIPAHTHAARGASAPASSAAPSSALVPARNPAQIPEWGPTADATMGADAISTAGGSQPHENQQPYLVLNYIISLQGTFPSQT
jgi:microcystin-dependent protein